VFLQCVHVQMTVYFSCASLCTLAWCSPYSNAEVPSRLHKCQKLKTSLLGGRR